MSQISDMTAKFKQALLKRAHAAAGKVLVNYMWINADKAKVSFRDPKSAINMGNIKRAVEAAGGTLDDVVSLRLYMPNYKPSEWQDVAAGLKENFPGANPPATTWIGITSLASADYLIEIEAFAVVGK